MDAFVKVDRKNPGGGFPSFYCKKFMGNGMGMDTWISALEIVLQSVLLSWFGVAGNYINAYVWKLYIDFFSQKRNDTRPIQKVYLKSNIAKYLPGNILQYADRNILGSQLGIGHKSIAAASVMELAVIVVSAVLFAAQSHFVRRRRHCVIFHHIS